MLQYSSLKLLKRECYEVEVQHYRKMDYNPMLHMYVTENYKPMYCIVLYCIVLYCIVQIKYSQGIVICYQMKYA